MNRSVIPIVKLLLLGDSGVGKTSLMNCFATEGEFSTDIISTAGVDYRSKQVELSVGDEGLATKLVTIQIWDTAGQERFRSITRQYYKGAMGIMLVFDCTDQQSFQHVSDWMSSINVHAQIGVPLLLVGNKIDLIRYRVVSSSSASALASSFHIPYIETSAKNLNQVESAFLTLARSALPLLPTSPTNKRNPSIEGVANEGVINLAERRRKKQARRCSSSYTKCTR